MTCEPVSQEESQILRALGRVESAVRTVAEDLRAHRSEVTAQFTEVHRRISNQADQINNVRVAGAKLEGAHDQERRTKATLIALISGSVGAAMLALISWLGHKFGGGVR